VPGFWEFPGGKREPGESFEDCLRRELREELALEVQPGELLESITHYYPEKTVHLRFFRCLCLEGEPQPIGCSAVAWASPGELGFYSFPEADARLLALLRRRADLWT
jgi:mutator protein MutT